MNIKQYFIDKDRITIYKKLSEEEIEELSDSIQEISNLKKMALDAQNSASDVEGWSINPSIHDKIALLHKYHLQCNDIPVAGFDS
jgi:hypothetical protein